MSGLTSLCVLVEVERIDIIGGVTVIKRVIRSYESRERADEDLELLTKAAPATGFGPGPMYRIDDIDHIER